MVCLSLTLPPSLSHRSNSRVYDYWVLWPYKTPLAHPLTHAHTLARTFSTSASPSLSLDTHSNQRGAILVHTRVTATLFLPERWSSRERERGGERERWQRVGGRERERHLFALLLICVWVSTLFLDLCLCRPYSRFDRLSVDNTNDKHLPRHLNKIRWVTLEYEFGFLLSKLCSTLTPLKFWTLEAIWKVLRIYCHPNRKCNHIFLRLTVQMEFHFFQKTRKYFEAAAKTIRWRIDSNAAHLKLDGSISCQTLLLKLTHKLLIGWQSSESDK